MNYTTSNLTPPVRNYKDTVFRMLFSEPVNALSLYNCLNNSNYSDVSLLEFNTLENAIYMGFKNDISFIIGDSTNLYEHQSSWNPNMPLRNLLYISNIYQNYISNVAQKSIYNSSLISLPNPRFVVFYNGRQSSSELSVLRLSDAFIQQEEAPYLELKTLVININSDKNLSIIQNCSALHEYITYVNSVRSYAATLPLEDAVNAAVDECIRNNILKDFLMRNKAEVVKMSIFEYDEEKELKLIRADERLQGIHEEQENSIKQLVTLCRQLKGSKSDLVKQLTEAYGFTPEEADFRISAYWNENI